MADGKEDIRDGAPRSASEIKRQPLVVHDQVAIHDTGAFEQMIRIANAMATAKLVPVHFQNSVGDCLMVVEQSRRWNMSPFLVAQKTYMIGGKLAYEAQLIAAVVNSNPLIEGRLNHRFDGEGGKRRCTVFGRIRGEQNDRERTSPFIENIKVKNSPLWKEDPDQQLTYWTQRSWARVHAPDLLLGVYTPEEIQYGEVVEHEPAPPRPTRADFVESPKLTEPFIFLGFDGSEDQETEAADAYARIVMEMNIAAAAGPDAVDGLWEANGLLLTQLRERGHDAIADSLHRSYHAALEAARAHKKPMTASKETGG